MVFDIFYMFLSLGSGTVANLSMPIVYILTCIMQLLWFLGSIEYIYQLDYITLSLDELEIAKGETCSMQSSMFWWRTKYLSE